MYVSSCKMEIFMEDFSRKLNVPSTQGVDKHVKPRIKDIPKVKVENNNESITNLNNDPKSVYNRAIYKKNGQNTNTDSLEAAKKAGHEFGKSIRDKNGKFFIYDKTDSKWLYDERTTKMVEELELKDSKKNEKLKDKYIKYLYKKYSADNIPLTIVRDEYDKLRCTGIYKKDYGQKNITGNMKELKKAIIGVNSDSINVSPYADKMVLWDTGYFTQRGYISNPVDRISLNVSGNENLIKELDTFWATGRYVDSSGNRLTVDYKTPFAYKTPTNPEDWGDREDPVTIYFSEKVNTGTFNAIRDITAKYQRGDLNYPYSNTITWMTEEPYVTNDMVIELLNKAKKTDSKIYNLINTYSSGSKHNGEYNMSTGVFHAMEHIFKEYCDYLKVINGEQIDLNEDFIKLNK